MARPYDTVTDARGFNIQKPEGPFAGPLVVQPEVKKPDDVNRIDELFEELADTDQPIGHSAAQLEFLEQLRKQDKQRFTPNYILQKDYQKSPYSFFSEGYDSDVETEFNPEVVDKEYKDFINFFMENVKKPEFQDIIGSQTLSPFAQEIMPSIQNYEKQHSAFPRDLYDLFQNRLTRDS
tara:strand:+ start:117 stop:653 length:537 start_codon:yes stop_codon:yes gene_type:complete